MAELIDIVSSRVKAEILHLLFGTRPTELHLRELVRQSGLSIGTIQQELRRLTRIGLVMARKAGNRVYYRANAKHPLHAELRSLVLKTSGVIGALPQALEDQPISLAFVFGSMARENTHAESDVDLMVIGSFGLRRLTHVLAGISDRIGRELNPYILTLEEFQTRKRRRDHFLTSILAGPKLFVLGGQDDLEAMGR